MKPLMLSVALASTADMLLRHGQGMQAILAGLARYWHAIAGWIFYTG